ncbi:unnamed protein product [Nezara viridula]|uniref:Uncharacterized protein n=1 Tax=Nezara viridula TaxID=85310 RepID=A0A9P0HBW5_NEZVI|nr:unnamed protein product [Nezara viridula]CAH1398988.1 unnamed protein product [Nezara viridula]
MVKFSSTTRSCRVNLITDIGNTRLTSASCQAILPKIRDPKQLVPYPCTKCQVPLNPLKRKMVKLLLWWAGHVVLMSEEEEAFDGVSLWNKKTRKTEA